MKVISYYQNILRKNQVVKVCKLRKDLKKKWVFFDMETLPCGRGAVHRVYAVGWYDCKTKKYYSSYGKNSLKEFLNWVARNEGKKYIAFNGAKFDFYFIQNSLLKGEFAPRYLNSNGRLLSLCWGGKYDDVSNRWLGESCVWDIALFMPGFSLKKACEAFDTKHQKKDFDHTKMKNWNTVAKYKDEVLHYLKYDVLSLKDLTEKYVDACETDYNASPTKYMTLSSFAENVWKSTLTGQIIEIPDLDKQSFIAKSVFGGRTYPSQKRFNSKFFDEINALWKPIQQQLDIATGAYDNPKMVEQEHKRIMKEHPNTAKLQKLYFDLKKSEDYIFNADINSQYPACMSGCDLMPTLFPTGFSEWIDDSSKAEQIFKDNKQLGMYTINFKCPKNLLHPILPRKKAGNGIEWSLFDGQGVYNTIDIQNALKFGYEIKFTGKALIWEGVSDTCFTDYVNGVYKLKVEASKEGNGVKRQIAKLMLNSIYGKLLQNPISGSESICYDCEDIERFASEHVITDWEIIEGKDNTLDYMILVGNRIDTQKIIKKPRHFGSFVLGYSRRLWNYFVEACDPTFTLPVTSYQDTDSLRISGKFHNKLEKLGLLDEEKIGYVGNDCKNDGLIFKEINLAPKCYDYQALDKNGRVWTTMKSKGIMKKKLKQEWYETETSHKVEWDGLKKIHRKVNSKDKALGVKNWKIKSQHYERTFLKNSWGGMEFKDNKFLPFDYKQTE